MNILRGYRAIKCWTSGIKRDIFCKQEQNLNETWLTSGYLLNGNILHHSFLNLQYEHLVVTEFVEKRKFWCDVAEISLELKWIQNNQSKRRYSAWRILHQPSP